jgi:drug/metabolite transporter (DMT)-like permease
VRARGAIEDGHGRANLGLALVVLGAVAFGFRPLFARLAFAGGLSPELAGLLMLGPTALACLPATLRSLVGERARGSRRLVAWALVAGVSLAVGNLAYLHALRTLTVATTTLIYFSYPLFVVLLGWLLIGARVSPRTMAAVASIAIGCMLILSPGSWSAADLPALLTCFLAPVSYAALLLLLWRKLTRLPLMARVGWLSLGATLVLLPASGRELAAMGDLDSGGWIGASGLVVICGFLPQMLTTVGVPMAGPDRAAIGGVMELVTSLALGWLMLREEPSGLEMLGAAAILSAVLLVRGERARVGRP